MHVVDLICMASMAQIELHHKTYTVKAAAIS